ncbi:Alpha/Beta hydrolase protein [Xylariales sp. AK1849]|nr:Alpha/Beta hydrolase protein [Xylariales sp. AK1849]
MEAEPPNSSKDDIVSPVYRPRPTHHSGASEREGIHPGRSWLSRLSLSSRRGTISSETTLDVQSRPLSGRVNTGKGLLGLTTVYQPSATSEGGFIGHIVFVHGLGGGSEHTWTKKDVFWPRDLLPYEDIFPSTMVHTFGYDSNFKKSSTLNIHDFSRSLLSSILNSPHIRDTKCPIVLVGHSMGGLVMKRAFLQAQQRDVYQIIAQRITAILFIATPHTGSGLAPTLSQLFSLSSGTKPYLHDLDRNSEAVQAINSEFPPKSLGLKLYSFYETDPLRVGSIKDVMIVPKPDAVLNYPNEQSAPLYGDHRSVCKFDSREDPNFRAIWQAIAGCLKDQSLLQSCDRPPSTSSQVSLDYQELNHHLGIRESPADDLYRVITDRLPGTCDWLSSKLAYHIGWRILRT